MKIHLWLSPSFGKAATNRLHYLGEYFRNFFFINGADAFYILNFSKNEAIYRIHRKSRKYGKVKKKSSFENLNLNLRMLNKVLNVNKGQFDSEQRHMSDKL